MLKSEESDYNPMLYELRYKENQWVIICTSKFQTYILRI